MGCLLLFSPKSGFIYPWRQGFCMILQKIQVLLGVHWQVTWGQFQKGSSIVVITDGNTCQSDVPYIQK
ncbi:hypothetical protein P8452_61865 [Trifolium repens]|nr:hypothetical protein P8452_61865 [Trifolium repens]